VTLGRATWTLRKDRERKLSRHREELRLLREREPTRVAAHEGHDGLELRHDAWMEELQELEASHAKSEAYAIKELTRLRGWGLPIKSHEMEVQPLDPVAAPGAQANF
jgi:hypothetical protein